MSFFTAPCPHKNGRVSDNSRGEVYSGFVDEQLCVIMQGSYINSSCITEDGPVVSADLQM